MNGMQALKIRRVRAAAANDFPAIIARGLIVVMKRRSISAGERSEMSRMPV